MSPMMLRFTSWDRSGYLLIYKRLERGTFILPTAPALGSRHTEIDGAELAMMLEGIDLRHPVRRKGWYRRPSGEPTAAATFP